MQRVLDKSLLELLIGYIIFSTPFFICIMLIVFLAYLPGNHADLEGVMYIGIIFLAVGAWPILCLPVLILCLIFDLGVIICEAVVQMWRERADKPAFSDTALAPATADTVVPVNM